MDLKAFADDFYRMQAGGRLDPVLDTLQYLVRETETWVEITTLLIPGLNDGEDELRRLSDWLVGTLGPNIPLHLSAFHPDFKLRDRPRTPAATLRRARAIARAAGLRHVYTGNVHDPEGDASICHGCGEVVIQRDWYELQRWRLDEAGCCRGCGTRLPGRIDGAPGTWGRRRQPVRIGR